MSSQRFKRVILFLVAAVALSSSVSQAEDLLKTRPYLLLSDIDDTMKISEIGRQGLERYYRIIKEGLFGKKIYSGTPSLFEELSRSASSVVYLSASPKQMEDHLQELLVRRSGFPMGEFILSDWFHRDDVVNFKYQQMAELAKRTEGPMFILGDDTQSDPAVYSQFQNDFGLDRVSAIYIHRVLNRPIPEGQIAFSTPFDVALSEVERGNLSPEQAIKVGRSILEERAPELLFPEYKYCPVDLPDYSGARAREHVELMEVNSALRELILSYCRPPQIQDYVEVENEVNVLHVTTDTQDGWSDLRVVLDANRGIQLLRFVTSKNKTIDFNVNQLLNGVVILNQDGRDVITLKSDRFSSVYGGVIRMIYLSNGITNSTDEFRMEVARQGGTWVMQGVDTRQVFKNMFIKGKRLFGSWGSFIGIESVSVD